MVKDIIQRFLDEIIGELTDGNRLEFREFGVFEVRTRAARIAQNPRTLEKVMVPANTTAEVRVPAAPSVSVTEGGRPAEEAPAVHFLRREDGAAVYRVGGGNYHFGSRIGAALRRPPAASPSGKRVRPSP